MVHRANVRPFVHLRVQSSYSLGVGLSSPADICAHAHRVGYQSAAMTDINGTYGFVEFHHAARSLGIKPLYGVLVVVDWRIGDDAPADERHSLTLIALDRSGLRNVCQAASVSATRREQGEGFYVTDLETLGEGVVCIVGLPSTVTAVLPRSSRTVLTSLKSTYGDRLFVETLVHVPALQMESRAQLGTLAASMDVAPVLCQDVRFVGQEKYQLIDLIGSGADAGVDEDRGSDTDAGTVAASHGMYSLDEMSTFYDRNQEAYTNASLIASLVQPDILDALGTSNRTVKSVPMFSDRDHVRRAFDERVREAFDAEFKGTGKKKLALWEARLKDELEIIHGTELEDTFLQFQQIVQCARRCGTLPGPATGLRLQSLCAYLLGISTFNPYRIDDGFRPFFDERERANRVLDLQITAGTRTATVAGLKELFDPDGVGYVPSVEHITAGRALKMVAQRFAVEPPEFADLLRAASRSPGANLQELCTQNRQIGFLYKKSAVLREIISHAASIEGLPYGFIRSKRTLIISPTPLREYLGETTNVATGDEFVQSTRDSFPIGSISRVDMTTLNALAVCARLDVGAADGLTWEQGAEHLDIYRMIQQGDVAGVFLLETDLIQRLAKSFGIASFDDLLCFLALMRYRRGGISLADRVKAYRDPDAAPPSVPESIRHLLTYTNGWILFHDQLRDVVSEVTGLDPLNSAQMVRRFARNEPAELAALRREFMMFAVEFGTPMEVATSTFTRILHSAGSTVPRQQIIAEALIVSAMLYLKKRKPVGYFTALVNVYRHNESKRSAYRERLGHEARMLPVDINESGIAYTVHGRSVVPPLWTIDGVSDDDAAAIARFTADNKIHGRADFDLLIADTGITYKAVEALVGAGALESVGIPAGEEVRPPIPVAPAQPVDPVDDATSGQTSGQLAFHLDSSGRSSDSSAPSSSTDAETQNGGNKRGQSRVLPTLAEFHSHPIAAAVELAGRISDLRKFTSSSGKTVGFFMLYDAAASVPVFVPWESIVPQGELGEPVTDGDHVSVRGIVRMREGMKVCEAVEVSAEVEGIDDGKTTTDESAEGNP